ncbi:SusC/RagA family TonB-linked outer membrane protein [Sphingobacterium rhinopitheci]|uniref:SusC/RagA family TonB-linked outer membrane protein n=1 Tax=Sphingobacterium rhinopitheci TaxID=2781960 RepID=UPI001F523244|nr:TonB-dependent receptor [Sphingobacterium rhinopitheci]MCI0920124.1 TonB-dependent receptor [Sphingobacterium rhinopitheci]
MKHKVFSKNAVYDDISHFKQARRGKVKLSLVLPLIFGLYCGNVTESRAAHAVHLNMTASNTDFQAKLTGRILDQNGKPVSGASIKLLGTKYQTESNTDGFFELDVATLPANAKIAVSYVGFKNQSVPVKANQAINVILDEDSSELDEVVVVGYGTQKKENLTGSVDVLSGKALADRPANNIADLIKGASPNMNISMGMRGGEPGAKSSWNLRGVGSINGNSSPLVLVDGVEMDLSSLDPESVESVSILKDASASAVYGSRAPFGVVLITTKKGKAGDSAQISYSNNLSSSSALNLPSFIDSYTWATAYNQANVNSGLAPLYSDEQMQRIKGYIDGTFEYEYDPNNPIANVFHGRRNGNANYDWPHILMGNKAFSQKHNVNVSGGSNTTQYYMSGGYTKQNGTYAFGYDYFQRYNFLSNLSSQVTKWLKFNTSIKYANSGTDFPLGETTVGREHTFREMQTFAPMMPYYNINGTIQSPLINLLEKSGRDKADHSDFMASIGAELEPIKGWKTIVNYNYNAKNSKLWSNPKPVMVELGNGTFGNIGKAQSSYTDERQETRYKLFNAVTSYETNWADHYFKGMLGFEQEENEYSALLANSTGLITDDLPSISTSLGDKSVDDHLNHWATRGVFGRINYNYQEKYLVELSARYNGSSRFPKHNRFGFFPSGSIGYVISKEDFFQAALPYINNLKVRASYGALGNQNVNNYLYYSRLNVSPNLNWIINNARPQYATVPALISDEITWETITTVNFGLDASLLRSRLGVTFDWYNRTTNDMLGPAVTLPYVLGAVTPLANNAKMETKGYEVVISWNDRLSDRFSYNLKFTLGDSKSKILEYRNVNGLIDTWYAGKMYGEIWGLTTDGLIQNAGESIADQSKYYSTWGPGDMKYVDVNADGKINDGSRTLDNHGDLKVIGNRSPRYNIGFTGGFRFDNFDFNMFWQGIGKQEFQPDAGSSLFWGMNASWQNSGLYKDSPGLDYWRPSNEASILGANTDAYFAKPYFTVETNKNRQVQSKYILNAAYFRMKNVQVGYTLPNTVLEKVFAKARIYFSGENLLTFTSLPKVFDPETAVASDPANGGSTASGVIYPSTKTYSFGVNLTFK